MAVRDLVIGMLLGDEETGKDPLFHYILDNSTNWIDLPIDNKFKYTASLLSSDRAEFYGAAGRWRGVDDLDIDDKHFSIPASWSQFCGVFFTAWENSVPLYSYIAGYSTYPDVEYANYQADQYIGDDGVSRRYYWLQTEQNLIPESLKFVDVNNNNFADFQFVFDRNNCFTHQINPPRAEFKTHQIYYDRILTGGSTHNPREFPTQKYIYSDSINTYSMLSINRYVDSIPRTGGSIFSDISTEKVHEKYNEIVKAIYASKGLELRNAVLDLEIVPNPNGG